MCLLSWQTARWISLFICPSYKKGAHVVAGEKQGLLPDTVLADRRTLWSRSQPHWSHPANQTYCSCFQPHCSHPAKQAWMWSHSQPHRSHPVPFSTPQKPSFLRSHPADQHIYSSCFQPHCSHSAEQAWLATHCGHSTVQSGSLVTMLLLTPTQD